MRWIFLLFLIVPVVVHLFDFRLTKKLFFSTTRFISRSLHKTKSNSRLKYYLILINRFLLFGAIVSILLSVNRQDVDGSSEEVSVLLDNSISNTINQGDQLIEDVISGVLENDQSIQVSYNSGGSIIDKLDDFSVPYEYNSLNQSIFLSKINRLDKGQNLIISDFQLFLNKDIVSELDSSLNYSIWQLNDLNEVNNVYVDSLWIESNSIDPSQVSINLHLNETYYEPESYVVKLSYGSRQLGSIVKSVSDPSLISFDVSINGQDAFEIKIEGDDVAYDDQFYFVIGERNRPKISILSSKNSQGIYEVFNSEFFDLYVVDINKPDYERLVRSDLIVFNGFNDFPQNILSQIPDKTYLIFPSESIDIQSYNQLTNDLSFSNSTSDYLELDVIPSHPLIAGVFENSQFDRLPRFRSIFNAVGAYESIIKYRDGSPFLLRNKSYYIFNTDLEQDSGFDQNALFLPILYQIAFSSTESAERPYFYPGDVLELDIVSPDVPMKLIGDETEIIPTFYLSSSTTIIEIPASIRPGFYSLMLQEDTIQQVAINVPQSESIMQSPGLEELKLLFKDYENVSFFQGIDDREDVLIGKSAAIPLWKYALILIVVLLISETFLHRYFR